MNAQSPIITDETAERVSIISPGESLIVIETPKALAIFSTLNGVDPILKRVRGEIDGFSPNAETKKGREAIASMAHRVARSKTYLDALGKALVDDLKDVPKKIDANRKKVRDTLDVWRDEVRKPLTDWENAEDARKARHENAIAAMAMLGRPVDPDGRPLVAAVLRLALERVEAVAIGPDCEEYEPGYTSGKLDAIAKLRAAIGLREREEAEAAELARLRAEEAARDAVRLKEAEAAAAVEAARVAKEREAKIAEEAAERERMRVEEEHQAALREAKEQTALAEKRAAEAVATAHRDAAERAAQAQREIDERANDREKRAKVHRSIREALVAGGIVEEVATEVIRLIASRKIPNVAIAY